MVDFSLTSRWRGTLRDDNLNWSLTLCSLHWMLDQFWLRVGPASLTVCQYWDSTGPETRVVRPLYITSVGSICLLWRPTSTIYWPHAGSMLGHRLRRWPNISPTLGQHLMLWRHVCREGESPQGATRPCSLAIVTDNQREYHAYLHGNLCN